MPEEAVPRKRPTRRRFLQNGAAALAALPLSQSLGVAELSSQGAHGRAEHLQSLNEGWVFGGKQPIASLENTFRDPTLPRVTLPHCVSTLSWEDWSAASWQDVWSYCRAFSVAAGPADTRFLLHFDRVMASASPRINGHDLPPHQGGFLPFEYEITEWIRREENLLSVSVDARWLNVPPAGSTKGPQSIDYFLPGGIIGGVSLRAVPRVFLRDVFATPTNVLSPQRQLEVRVRIDAGAGSHANYRLIAALHDKEKQIAQAEKNVTVAEGDQEVSLPLKGLEEITLWDFEQPRLYNLVVTLFAGSEPVHSYHARIGFREARFATDGFFLNGKRRQLFGLNRHELFPYTGFAMPDRVQRRDAEILRHELNCNMVRCSHYPQSEAFLDACDELGLVVWQETPGWQYIGDRSWQDLAVENVRDMILRDRNRPSVVIWGVRINESSNDPDFYHRTREVAHSLDGTRPTSGTMTPSSLKTWETEWHEDVFAYDDYHADPAGGVGIHEPIAGVPFLIAEAVGQFNYKNARGFNAKYRRAGDPSLQAAQAIFHAQAHDRARAFAGCAGVIAWCAFDYASLINSDHGVKCPGVSDIFRLPKLGAAFYRSQVDPRVKPVIEPGFYWDFGPSTPLGPGASAAIFSNCDRLEVFLDGKHLQSLSPDRKSFPNLPFAPFFADLAVSEVMKPELRIDGYLRDKFVLSRTLSADPSRDRFWLKADDAKLECDGADATRLAFAVSDQYGNARLFAGGNVSFTIEGPAVLVGDHPFDLAESGGVGAVWIKTLRGRAGWITVEATHSKLGRHSIRIQARAMPIRRHSPASSTGQS